MGCINKGKALDTIFGMDEANTEALEPSFSYDQLARTGKATPEMQQYLADVFTRGVALGEGIQKSDFIQQLFSSELPCCTESLNTLHVPCTVCVNYDES